MADEPGEDFGVGLGGELDALFEQFGLEGEVIFDDTVVDDGNRAGLVGMSV